MKRLLSLSFNSGRAMDKMKRMDEESKKRRDEEVKRLGLGI